MSRDNLKIYLNDHLAGSVSAIELLEELIKSTGDASTSFLSQLKSDIEADQQELKALIQRLDMAESGPRKAAAWLAGKLVDLKSMVADRSSGPLWRFEVLEALVLGITGKLELWRALAAIQEASPKLRGTDYESLADRAKDQRRRAETARLEAAKEALA